MEPKLSLETNAVRSNSSAQWIHSYVFVCFLFLLIPLLFFDCLVLPSCLPISVPLPVSRFLFFCLFPFLLPLFLAFISRRSCLPPTVLVCNCAVLSLCPAWSCIKLSVCCRRVTSSQRTLWTCWGSSPGHAQSPRRRSSAWFRSSTRSSRPSRCSWSRAPARPSWSCAQGSLTPGKSVTTSLTSSWQVLLYEWAMTFIIYSSSTYTDYAKCLGPTQNCLWDSEPFRRYV